MRLWRGGGEALPSFPPPSGDPLPTGPGRAYVKLVRAHLVHEATLSTDVLYKQKCLWSNLAKRLLKLTINLNTTILRPDSYLTPFSLQLHLVP